MADLIRNAPVQEALDAVVDSARPAVTIPVAALGFSVDGPAEG